MKVLEMSQLISNYNDDDIVKYENGKFFVEVKCQFTEREEHERAEAYAKIRSFLDDRTVEVKYKTTAPNPYIAGDRPMELYVTNNGYEFWVEPKGDKIIQYGPVNGPDKQKLSASSRLPISTLRIIANGICAGQIENFMQNKKMLHPLEDNRNREIYFFRWDDFSQPVKESELPPFVQVGIYANGKIASFTNTL